MHKHFRLLLLILVAATPLITSCEEDNDYTPYNKEQTSSSKVSKPVFEKNLTTTTTSTFSLRCRFNNGGDTSDNMQCTVHYRKYSTKPSKQPTTSDMYIHESMRQYGSTSKTTTFDKSHAGVSGGTYIYYYFECSNSKYKAKTNVTYCIVKR